MSGSPSFAISNTCSSSSSDSSFIGLSGAHSKLVVDRANEGDPDIPEDALEIEEREQLLIEGDNGEVIKDVQEEVVLQDNNEDINIQEDDEGLVAVRNDNIVSEEEDFIEESESEDAFTVESEPEEIPVVAALDGRTQTDIVQQTSRPRRINAGSGVDRLQMRFEGKGYGSRREFNLITNGKKETYNIHNHEYKAYMDIACDVVFAHMSDGDEPQRYSQMPTKKGF